MQKFQVNLPVVAQEAGMPHREFISREKSISEVRIKIILYAGQ